MLTARDIIPGLDRSWRECDLIQINLDFLRNVGSVSCDFIMIGRGLQIFGGCYIESMFANIQLEQQMIENWMI